MGKTISEKIIAAHAGHDVAPGDLVVVPVDGAMATDATGPFALRAFQEMGGTQLWDPTRFALILDHATPAPNERIANLHRLLRDFARDTGCAFYDVGRGICHQIMAEEKRVRPGDIFVGADSHTTTLGAFNAFATGMGSTDLAAIMRTGKTWLKVPHSIKIRLDGVLPNGVTPKDLVLFLVGRVGLDGATYAAVEFTGEAIRTLSPSARMTVANMSAEMGAKVGIVDPAGLPLHPGERAVSADPDAHYSRTFHFDVSDLQPQVSQPHSPDDVTELQQIIGQRVDYAFIGSCTNARIEDLHAAALVLKGRQVATGVRLLIAPASQQVWQAALADGTVATLAQAGATFLTPGCGPCVGTHGGVPGDDEVVISSTNRNFRGRMGNPNASIYLASPAVVAAAAASGHIADPRELLAKEQAAWTY